MREEIVVDISGNGLEDTLKGLDSLVSKLESAEAASQKATNTWATTKASITAVKEAATGLNSDLGSIYTSLSNISKVENPFSKLRIRASLSTNYEKLDTATRSLLGSTDALLKPLGRSVGGIMRLKGEASQAAGSVKSLASAYRALTAASNTPTKGSNVGTLMTSYASLDGRVQKFITTLGNLTLAYQNVALAQGSLAQHNKNTFMNPGAGAGTPGAGGGAGGPGSGGLRGSMAGRFASSVGGYVARFGAATGLIVAGHEVSQYEDKMAHLGATINANETQMQSFRDMAVSAAKQSRIGIVELTDAMVELAKAGLDKPKQLRFLAPVVTKAAVAGGMSAEDTTAMGVEAMSQFNMRPSELPDMFGKATKAANLSVIGFKELRTSLKYAGEAASSLGTEFEPVLAAIATLGQVGKKGSTGGTTLRQMMSQLAIGNEKTTKFLDAVAKKTGIQRDRLDITKNSLVDVLQLLKDAEPTAKDLFATFDKQGGSGFIGLVNNIGMMKDFLKEIDAAGFEEVERVAARLENTLGGQAGRLKNTIVATAAEINTALGDPFKVAFSLLADLIGGMGELAKETKSFSEEWPIISTSIKAVATAIGLISLKGLITAMATLVAQTKMAQGFVGGMRGAFLGANAGATTLNRNRLWATLKANKGLILAAAGMAIASQIEDEEGNSLLTRGLVAGKAGVRSLFEGHGLINSNKTGYDKFDRINEQIAVLEKDQAEGKITDKNLKKLDILKDQKYAIYRENPNIYDKDVFQLYRNQMMSLKDEAAARRDEIRKSIEEDADLDAGYSERDKPTENVLPPEIKKVKHNPNELVIAYEKAERRRQESYDNLFKFRDATVVARERLAYDAQNLAKSFLGIDQDQDLPKEYQEAVKRIAENPSDAKAYFEEQIAKAEKLTPPKLSANLIKSLDGWKDLKDFDVTKIMAGDFSSLKGAEKFAKAARAEIAKFQNMKSGLIARNKNLKLLSQVSESIERSEQLDTWNEQIKAGESASSSIMADIEKAANSKEYKASLKFDGVLELDSLQNEVTAVKELYANKIQVLEDLQDLYNKAGMADAEVKAQENLKTAQENLVRIAKGEAQKKATDRFKSLYNPLREQSRARFSGASILELTSAVSDMERIRDEVVRVSQRDSVLGNITPEQMTAQINAATKALEEFEKHASSEMFTNWAKDVAFAMTDTIGNGFQSMFDAMLDGTKDMGDVLKSVLKSIISQAFSQTFVRPVTDIMKTMLNQAIGAVGQAGAAAAGGYGINNPPPLSEASSVMGPGRDGGVTQLRALSLQQAPTQDPWVAQAYRGRPNTSAPTEHKPQGPVTGPNGEIRNAAGTSVTNINMTVNANDPASFRSSQKQIRAALMKRAR